MKFNQLVNTFTSGEWSPKMRARTDAEEYPKSCEILKNFLPKIQGGAFRRPGTVMVSLDPSADADLQSMVDASFVKSKMMPILLSDNSRRIIVASDSTPSTTWVVFDAASPTASGGSPTVGAGADFPCAAASNKVTQVGDYLFITNPSISGGYPVRVWRPGTFASGDLLLMDAAVATKLSYLCFPYLPPEALGTSVNLTPSGATGAITLTASSAFFSTGHVGAYFKLSSGGNTAVAKITSYTSATVVSATVVFGTAAVAAHGTAAGTSWEESAWSDARGWPRYVTSYQGRLIFGGSKSYPETVWGSRIGNVFDFMERPLEQDPDFTGYTDDNSRPFTLTPNTGSSGPIVGLTAGRTLMILTERGEIVGFGTNGALGPNDASFESSSSFGAASPMATRANNFSVFVQKGGRIIRDIVFTREEDSYKSSDLMFVADHLTLDPDAKAVDPIVEIMGAELDSSFVFAKTQNGRLFALTIDKDYKINAWSRIEFGGHQLSRSYPMVKSMCAIPKDRNSPDRLWFLVQRYTDGANRMFLEYMDLPQEFDTFDVGSAFASLYAYVDLKRTYNPGAPTTTLVTGLSYLEGETLQVIADGQYIGEFVADASGNITIPSPASYFVYGFKYESLLKTSPIETGHQIPGSPQGIMKRIEEVTIKFYLSYGAKYGSRESDLLDIGFKDPNQIMNQPPTLFTGYKTLKMPSNYDREVQAIVKTDKPWPCNVLSVICKGVTYD